MLIVASGSIGDLDGRPVDILGLGLKGTAGLVRYLTLLAVLLGITLAAVPLAARSWRDRGIVRRLAAWLPGIGPALVAAEAAAWCRAAAMAGHAGLNAGRLVELAAGAAPGLRISAAEIESRLRAGDTLDAALAASGRLPKRVIEAVEVGELTGTTPETLDRLVPQLEDEARAGLEMIPGPSRAGRYRVHNPPDTSTRDKVILAVVLALFMLASMIALMGA